MKFGLTDPAHVAIKVICCVVGKVIAELPLDSQGRLSLGDVVVSMTLGGILQAFFFGLFLVFIVPILIAKIRNFVWYSVTKWLEVLEQFFINVFLAL